MAILSRVAATRARTCRYSAWRSRWMTWFDTSAGLSRSWAHTCSSIWIGMPEKVPTGPESIPTDTRSFIASARSRFRRISDHQRASLSPKDIGSAWMPWDRPMQRVCLNSTARIARADINVSIPWMMRDVASDICIASAVSLTSLEVSPWCIHRPSSPRLVATARVKDTRSWRVSSNWRSYSSRENVALRIFRMSSSLMTPSFDHASQAAISTLSQRSN